MTRRPPSPTGTDLQVMQQLAELDTLTIEQLTQRWQMLMDGAPAPRRNRQYLVKRLAYRLQELVYGGLSPEARTRLADTYQRQGHPARSGGAPREHATLPGTCLLRAWHGTMYRVTVCHQGFEYDGRLYASLTAIAREITGAKCSGPAFFRMKVGQA